MLANVLGVDVNPVNRIHELEDDPSTAYLWNLDCSDRQLMELTSQAREDFVRKNNRDPRALHLIRNDVSSLDELSEDQVREVVQPWLQSQDEVDN
jgi:hypothetical protein